LNHRSGILDKCLLFLGVLIGGLFVAFGYSNFPQPGVDSGAFVPAGITWAIYGEPTNPAYVDAVRADPEGLGRYVYHGPMFPWFIGILTGCRTADQALTVIYALSAFNVVLFCVVCIRGNSSPLSGLEWIFCVLGLLAFASIHLYVAGRPGTLSITLGLLTLLALKWHIRRVSLVLECFQWLLVGCILGLHGVTHPVPSVMNVFCVTLWIASRYGPREAIVRCVGVGSMALFTFFAWFACFYPYSISDWVHGVLTHAENVTGGSSFRFFYSRIDDYWIWHLAYPGAFAWAGVGVASFIWLVLKNRLKIKTWSLFIPSCILICVTAFRYSIAESAGIYNIFGLFPFLCVVVLVVMKNYPITLEKRPNFLGVIVVVTILATTSIGLARTALLFPHYLMKGDSLDLARDRFNDAVEGIEEVVSVSSALWTLTENYNRVLLNAHFKNVDYTDGEAFQWMAVQQTSYSLVDEIPGYCVVYDYRVAGKPRFLGVPLARSYPGYQFRLFRRCEDDLGDGK
jgi:hypothetical protein